MKDVSKARVSGIDRVKGDILQALFEHLLFAVFGFFAAKGRAVGGIMPFGLAVIGGAHKTCSLSAAAGAIIGYMFAPSDAFSFRYLVAAAGIAAIKMLASGAVGGEVRPMFSGIAAALVTLATGIVTVKNDFMDIVTAVVETLIAASGAYFISLAVKSVKRQTVGLNGEELSSLLIASAIVSSGLFGINLGPVSIGRMAAAVVIMMTARFGSAGISAVCGVVYGIMALMCFSDSSVLVMLSFSGVLAGAFSKLGKYGVLTAFIISAFVSSAVVQSENTVLYMIEAAAAAVIFLLIPKSACIKFGKIVAPRPSIEAPTGLKKSVTMRLKFAATALSDVSETVEQVAHELAKVNAPEFNDVFAAVEQDACKGCSFRIHCWEAKRESTVSAIIEMTRAVKAGETQPEIFAGEEFSGRCIRLPAMGNAVYRHYSEYAARIAAENRIDEVRGVVSDQFSGISNMLIDLSGEIENGENYDNAAAEEIVSGLKSIDIIVDGCCCKIDKYGRMNVEIRLKSRGETVVNRMQIMRQVSLVCDRDFDAPVVTVLSTETLINLNERARLKADIGVNQIAKDGKSMCGDAYKYFLDGRGRAIMVLSDGMGTGGRAAVDSAMASGLISRLIKAGFGYDCSLRILNSSMIFKSTDESLATVDIAVIDLFTGRTDLFKAGAAPTLVRRSGRTGKAQSTSLPAGILRDIAFDKATFRLKEGDILLLLSDGATADGTEWICAELENWSEGSAQQLSEHLSLCAKRRRTDEHDDDISVLAVILDKAV